MFFLNSLMSSIWIDGQGMTAKKLAKYKNQTTFLNVYALLLNEAILGRYRLKNLPETVNERVVLESLVWYGSVGFFIKQGNILALPGLPTGAVSLYRDPIAMNVHAPNGFVEEIKLFIPNGDNSALVRSSTSGVAPIDGSGVWIRENPMSYPFINHVIDYADKIADTYRTLDTTRKNLKKPYVVVAEESIVKSVANYFRMRDNNEEFMIGEKSKNGDAISSGVFPVDKVNLLPFETHSEDLRECTMLIEWYLNQFRQLEGIKVTSTVDKKAQISVDELNRDQMVTTSKKTTDIEFIQKQFDFANEKLGMNIRIEKVEDEDDESMGNPDNEVQ